MSKLEQAAQAIYEAECPTGRLWSDRAAGTKRAYIALARAAIAALREPTPSMIEFGHLCDPLRCDVDDASSVYPPIWRGMIDAVLSEEPK